jgi:hypothetical protein
VDAHSPEEPLSGTAYSAESPRARQSGFLVHTLAGLQAGVVGVFWMFGCFVVAALMDGRGIWSVPNVFSTAFYGDGAYQDEFQRTTWAGIALILVVYGFLGALWGLWWKDERKPLLRLFGVITGLVTYYVFFEYIWFRIAPLIPYYAPTRQMQVAHILWGAALAASPVYSKRIAQAIAPARVEYAAGTAGIAQSEKPDDAESVSGELIL